MLVERLQEGSCRASAQGQSGLWDETSLGLLLDSPLTLREPRVWGRGTHCPTSWLQIRKAAQRAGIHSLGSNPEPQTSSSQSST